MSFLHAYVRAFESFPLSKEDFVIPSVVVPVEPVTLEQSEIIAEKLEKRLSLLQKKASFDGFVLSELPIIHQKRLEEIRFLKRQIVLRELSDELSSAEEMISAIAGNNPALQDILRGKVAALKKIIDEKRTGNP